MKQNVYTVFIKTIRKYQNKPVMEVKHNVFDSDNILSSWVMDHGELDAKVTPMSIIIYIVSY